MFFHAFDFPSSLKIFSKIYNNRGAMELWSSPLLGEKIVDDLDRKSIYGGKGYWENDRIVSESELLNNEFRGTKIKINGFRLDYLKKLIKLALNNGCKVILVSAPIPPTSYKELKNYEDFYQDLAKVAEYYKIDYIDFNIINAKEKLFKDAHFQDDDHLNKYGVELFDEILVEYIQKHKKSKKMHVDSRYLYVPGLFLPSKIT